MKTFSVIVSAVVVASVVAGFFVVGSPARARLEQLDQRRVSDLQSIQSYVVSFWQSKERLPKTLDELKDDLRGVAAPADPETGAAYEYDPGEGATFTLCATFALKSDGASSLARYPSAGGPFTSEEIWAHDAGRVCFERAIDPDFFKLAAPAKERL